MLDAEVMADRDDRVLSPEAVIHGDGFAPDSSTLPPPDRAKASWIAHYGYQAGPHENDLVGAEAVKLEGMEVAI